MPDDFGDKTEAPSPRRRQEARDEGNIARSQDLTAAVMLFGAVLLLDVFGRQIFGSMKLLMATLLASDFTADTTHVGDIGQLWALASTMIVRLVAPISLAIMALALAASLVQVGVLVTFKPLQPNFNKLSPLKGIQQIFSARGGVRLGMSLGKVAAVLLVAGLSMVQELPMVMGLVYLDMGSMFIASASLVYSLALRIAVVLLILAILDYAYQRWQHETDLKMTKQEVKEEFKRMEGDPMIKQRRAKVARQLAMQRLSSAVPNADVIVTNPTHFSIALAYDSNKMGAPKVVAKGADYMALRIRQIAVAHGIPIVERKPLARALYRSVEVGQEIPAEHYAAVAEILAYVYRLRDERRSA